MDRTDETLKFEVGRVKQWSKEHIQRKGGAKQGILRLVFSPFAGNSTHTKFVKVE